MSWCRVWFGPTAFAFFGVHGQPEKLSPSLKKIEFGWPTRGDRRRRVQRIRGVHQFRGEERGDGGNRGDRVLGEEVQHDPVDKIRLLLHQEVRGSRHDGELGVRQISGIASPDLLKPPLINTSSGR